MLDKNFLKADRLFWHDPLVKRLFLWAIPKTVHPNHITVFRLLATPFVAWLMYYENYSIGLVAFLLVGFTDILDGSLARTRNQVTNWGKVFDPVTDKILISAMVFIIVLRYIDFWTSMVIVFLEVVIIVVATIRGKQGKIAEANVWGKIKMGLQTAGVTFLLLSIVFNLEGLLPVANGALYLGIAFAIISLLTYGI